MCSSAKIKWQSRVSIVGICSAFTGALGSPPSHARAAERAPAEGLCSCFLPEASGAGEGRAEGFKGGWGLPLLCRRESGLGWGSCVLYRGVSWKARAGRVCEWTCECVNARMVRARRMRAPLPRPSPGLHLDLIWSGRDSSPAGPTRNEKLPSCEALSLGRCAARPLGRWQRRGPRGPGAGPTGPGAQKWWIDQIDEAGLVPGHWLSRRFWSEPGPGPPVALGLTCPRSAAGPGCWRAIE